MAQVTTEEKLNESEKDNVNESKNQIQTITEDVVNRPPRPPESALGPYYQFITTDLENNLWIGSVLIFRHVSYEQPKIEFITHIKIVHEWEILYENLFDMRAYRVNLKIELPKGDGDEKIGWRIDWGNYSTDGVFHIAQYDQKWRGAFFSCNGFDATVSKEVALGLTYNTVWKHLLSVHQENPFHLLVWGGDQNYNDFVFEDVQFLQDWSHMKWNDKWTCQFRDESKQEIEQYYFNNYAEHWERRPEMKKALGSIPSLMMWDDHDIFDGAGSYPPIINESPVIMGLFEIAQKMRLLFQHHTTPEKARHHRLFGYHGHNFLAQCGPDLAFLGADGRTERNDKTVQHDETWNIVFEKLNSELQNVKHLIVVFPVPFSYVRFKIAETLLETWKKLSMRWQNIPLSEQTNSVFGLPELYDDLLDEWTHEAHMDERNRCLSRFQKFAHQTKTRITFFSGDVHCCGVSRFQSRDINDSSTIHDSKLMYQIISSAIVNRPPPRIVIRSIHLFATTWYPIVNTEESLVDFFERAPESRGRLFLKKLLPNRNWCYFEQCITQTDTPFKHTVVHSRFLDKYFWPFIDFLLLLTGLGWILSWKDRRSKSPMTHSHQKSQSSSSVLNSELKQEINSLKIRFWLENSQKNGGEPPFANYDLFIPDLK